MTDDASAPTPLDWIMLCRDEVKARLDGLGLHNARVVGWAGAGEDLGGPAEIEVDAPEVTDLTAGDLARLAHEPAESVGTEVCFCGLCGWASVACRPVSRSGTGEALRSVIRSSRSW